MKLWLVYIALTLSCSSFAMNYEQAYFTIDSIEHRALTDEEVAELEASGSEDLSQVLLNFPSSPTPFPSPGGGNPFDPINPFPTPGVGGPGGTIRDIINTGKEIWDVIKNNRPTRTESYEMASALPKGVSAWNELHSWKLGKSKIYQVKYKNSLGMSVIDFKYRVVFAYNGTDGVGRYLSRIGYAPVEVTVGWGYNFNAKGKVNALYNVGNKEAAIAAAELQLDWSAESNFSNYKKSVNFTVNGEGEVEQF